MAQRRTEEGREERNERQAIILGQEVDPERYAATRCGGNPKRKGKGGLKSLGPHAQERDRKRSYSFWITQKSRPT